MAVTNPADFNGHDLATLSDFTETDILQRIADRYSKDQIYTYIGDILLAVNPFKPLEIYSFEVSLQYANVALRPTLPPHIFAVADKAYSAMSRYGRRQSCVISGESGAGKTESAKYLIGHIISHCSSSKPNLQEKILQVNPLLEAFGNASTIMNDNSSRFGKFIELLFTHDGKVVGARIDTYLLEKSRVVTTEKGERNFHIFYFMFAGLTQEQLKNVCLEPPESYRVLNSGGAGVYFSDQHFMHCLGMFDELQEILELVGFTQEQIWMIYSMLSAILQTTQITFDQDPETGGAYIEDEYTVKVVAQLLEVDPEAFVNALITNTVEARGEKILTLRSVAQAEEARDALAKSLYSKLFMWIVSQINQLLAPSPDTSPTPGYEIGILDIYGFENFKVNGFEQLCINLTNEQLQFYFNQRIFKWELEEYGREGIKKSNIGFQDNQAVLDLIIGRPMGLLSLLDEESRFPRSTDVSFVNKLGSNLHKNKNFIREKRANSTTFGIVHYAGTITYEATGFLEKNRDSFSNKLTECLLNSTNGLVRFFFTQNDSDLQKVSSLQKEILQCRPPPKITRNGAKSISRAQGKRLQKQLKESQKKNKHIKNGSNSSVGSKFKASLASLMEKLLISDPQFVRCLKPNSRVVNDYFDFELVLRQLRYNGVLETIRIRREGYPLRLTYEDFLKRYKILLYSLTSEVKVQEKQCKRVSKSLKLTDCEIGKSKVFLKYWHVEKLDAMIDDHLTKVIICQKVVRGFLGRRRFKVVHQRYAAEQTMMGHFLAPMEDTTLRLLELQNKAIKEDGVRHEKAQKESVRFFASFECGFQVFMPLPPNKALYMDLQKAAAGRQALARPEVNGHDRAPSPQPMFRKREAPKAKTRRYPPGGVVAGHQLADHGRGVEEDIMEETLQQLPRLNREAWAKIYFMEKAVKLGHFAIKSPAVTIDGHKFQYPGRLGFGALGNPQRDEQTEKIREHIGKGIQLDVDRDGNVWATRLARNDVIVKGCLQPDQHCISKEVVQVVGRLEQNNPMKVFDLVEFKAQLAQEKAKGIDNLDHRRLARLSLVSLSFVKDTALHEDTPCWVCIVVLPAMRLESLSPNDHADVDRLLAEYQPAAEKSNTRMGRSTSKRWAKPLDGQVQHERGNFDPPVPMKRNLHRDEDGASVGSVGSNESNSGNKGRGLRAVYKRNQATFRLRNYNAEDLTEALSVAGDEIQGKQRKQWAKQANQRKEARTIFSDM